MFHMQGCIRVEDEKCERSSSGDKGAKRTKAVAYNRLLRKITDEDLLPGLLPGRILEMKPAENVWDAIAADLAAVTAATDGTDEKTSEELAGEAQKGKNSESMNDSGTPRPEPSQKGTQDGNNERPELDTNGNNSSNTLPRYVVKAEPQGGVKVNNPPAPLIIPKQEEGEQELAQNVVEILSDSSDEEGEHADACRGDEKNKGENTLGKRNRSLDQTVSGGSGKKTKFQLSDSSDGAEISQREQMEGTTRSGETANRAKEQRYKPQWGDSTSTPMPLLPGLEKLRRVFTSLNTACGYLLKQQLVPSWQNVKQAIQQISGDSEPISVEDVRRLAQMFPQMVILTQFSGGGEDASFHIELFDPSEGPRVDVPGISNGIGASSVKSSNSSDPKSAGKQVSDSEAKELVEKRQIAFQLSLAQMAVQFQVSASAGERLFGDVITSIRSLAPQSGMVPVSGDERAKHNSRHILPATLRLPSHEGRHTLGAPLLPLPTQPIGLPPASLMPPQLQHGFMNLPGGYTGMPFPLPVQPTNAFGPFSSFSKAQANNYAGYQLSNLPPLPNFNSVPSIPPSPVSPPSNSVAHKSQSTVTPLVVDVPEAAAAPVSSPYHGMSLNKAKRRRSRNWDNWEVVLLVQAKKTEWERPESSSGKERFDTAVERWKRVESFLKENKVVDRDAAACKNKWEAILSDYKSIKDWNRKPGNTVYSLLSPAEKKAANLPAVFPSSVMELLDTFSFSGKSSASAPAADSLTRNNTTVYVGAPSGEDASGPEDNGEAHPTGKRGDGIQGPAGRKKKSSSSSPLVAAFDRLTASMLSIEKGRDERSERVWALENRKYDLEKSKFELQARKVEAEREDRKGLVRVLGNLAGAFHRMADKM